MSATGPRRKKTTSTGTVTRVSRTHLSETLTVCVALKLGFGTSDQVQVSGPEHKRSESLHHPGKTDRTVDIHATWKSKFAVPAECNPPRTETT